MIAAPRIADDLPMRRAALLTPVLSVIFACGSRTAEPAPAAAAKPAAPTPAAATPDAPTTAPAPKAPEPPAPRPDTAGWQVFEGPDGKYGFKDAGGKVVLPPRYAVADGFSPAGVACVADDAGWSCIDGAGATVLRPYLFDNGPDPFSDGLARFVEGDKVGFYDDKFVKVIPARYDFAGPFADGRAPFCSGCARTCDGEHCSMTGGKWGLLDRTGAEVVAPRFDRISGFEGGTARAVEGGAEKTIDPQGNVVAGG